MVHRPVIRPLPMLVALAGLSLATLPALAQTSSPSSPSRDAAPSNTETPARQSAPAQANEASGHDSQTGKPETGPEATQQGQGPQQEKPPAADAEKMKETKDKR